MKAKLTLTEQPSAMYLMVVLDVLALLLVLFILIPGIAQQAGFMFDLPESEGRLAGHTKRITITVQAGPQPIVYIGTRMEMKRVEKMEDFEGVLEEVREKTGAELAVLYVDQTLEFGTLMPIVEAVQRVGLQSAMGARPSMRPPDQPAKAIPVPEADPELESPTPDEPGS